MVLTEKRESRRRTAAGRGGVSLAVLEHAIETGSADCRELIEMTVEGGIDIGHQRELRCQRIGVEVCCFVEHDESREVHVGEPCERNDIPVFAVIGNRAEDRFQRRRLVRA